jgi:hypothetical protein
MFSSYLSVRHDTTNFCLATKHDGRHNNNYESLHYVSTKIKTLTDIKNIVLFTDVIGTGNTVLKVKRKIEELAERNDFIWSFVSILADNSASNRSDLSSFHFRGTLCNSLKIPILKNIDLPDFNVLPAKYDIT